MAPGRIVKPLIGISCCTKQFGVFGMPNHAASNTYIRATDELLHAVPVLLPANGPTCDIETLLAHLDGIMLTGSRSNVHPSYYDGPPHAEGTWEDLNRDSTTLPLIRAAVIRGVPLLAICRGFQELNVAMGGSLHQRLQDLPDRIDHSSPMQASVRVRQGKAHSMRLTPGGWLHKLAGTGEIAVNSLHNQGVDRLAPGLVVEGTAPDGTIEAARVVQTPAGPAHGFAVGVQWHPEYDWPTDSVSRRIFESFATAVRAYAGQVEPHPLPLAAD
ncbi:MAG TPA: gamma-glutamyl-gamma-aminobutyrate hydrolase family protein [Acetobacteraceae bacterium]|nr:gamma-glutamyl-gamma-aminobutyrate hydrolase family protein [Acetobacteraceae bacterium]